MDNSYLKKTIYDLCFNSYKILADLAPLWQSRSLSGMNNTGKSLIIILIVIFVSCDRRYEMDTVSMEPTIKKGQSIRVDIEHYKNSQIERWDIVAFNPPVYKDRTWVFRVVGLPGETIDYDSTGLIINKENIDLPKELGSIQYRLYIEKVNPFSIIKHPYNVPENSYYLLGDNTNANDSRLLGAIPYDSIVGYVQLPE